MFLVMTIIKSIASLLLRGLLWCVLPFVGLIFISMISPWVGCGGNTGKG